jgi:iron-sulfur cluster repair protein YtfE (RIC family)
MDADTLNRGAVAADDTLNAIVARYPDTLPVLHSFGLDTCCGGALPLRAAALHHDLDLGKLIEALHMAIRGGSR